MFVSGNGSVNLECYQSTTKSISFGKTFSSIPTVVVILKLSNPDSWQEYSISNITTTKFSLYIKRFGEGSSGYIPYHWYARN